jgi:hypothetical protein
MKRIKEIIDRNASGKKVLMLFILTNIVYLVMLTITIPNTMEFSEGMKLLDMMPTGYNPEYVVTLFDTLGEEGRATYLFQQIPLDMAYPFLFGLSYCLLMAYFLKRIGKFNSFAYYLCFLPAIAGIFDYLENVGIIILLNDYPGMSLTAMKATSAFSMIKSMTTTVYFVALIFVLVLFGIHAIRKRKKTNKS